VCGVTVWLCVVVGLSVEWLWRDTILRRGRFWNCIPQLSLPARFQTGSARSTPFPNLIFGFRKKSHLLVPLVNQVFEQKNVMMISLE
jgi:hypothetical protein